MCSSSGGILHGFPSSHPRPTNLHEALWSPAAIIVGLLLSNTQEQVGSPWPSYTRPRLMAAPWYSTQPALVLLQHRPAVPPTMFYPNGGKSNCTYDSWYFARIQLTNASNHDYLLISSYIVLSSSLQPHIPSLYFPLNSSLNSLISRNCRHRLTSTLFPSSFSE